MNINEAILHILGLSDEDVENEVLSGNESDHVLDDSTFESSTPSSSKEYTGNGRGLVSKDGLFVFTRAFPFMSGRLIAQNQVTFTQGMKKNSAKRFFSSLGALELFVTDEMVDRIIQSTNRYIENKSESNFRITEKDL